MTYKVMRKHNTIIIQTWSQKWLKVNMPRMRQLKNIASKYSNMKQNTTEAKKINMLKTTGPTRLILRD